MHLSQCQITAAAGAGRLIADHPAVDRIEGTTATPAATTTTTTNHEAAATTTATTETAAAPTPAPTPTLGIGRRGARGEEYCRRADEAKAINAGQCQRREATRQDTSMRLSDILSHQVFSRFSGTVGTRSYRITFHDKARVSDADPINLDMVLVSKGKIMFMLHYRSSID
jgi:hypothetical protein